MSNYLDKGVGQKGVGAPPASQDRVTDASHEAGKPSSPSGSVPTGAWGTNIARLSDGSISVAHVVDGLGNAVAQIHNYGEEQTVATTHLISAAPDYDAAAEMLLKWFDHSGSGLKARWDRIPPEEAAGIVNAFRAARAKARGGQS